MKTSSSPKKIPISRFVSWSKSHEWHKIAEALERRGDAREDGRARTLDLLLAASFRLYKCNQEKELLRLGVKLRKEVPRLVELLLRENSSPLRLSLSQEEREELNQLLPIGLRLHEEHVSLLRCYQDPRFPPQALHMLEGLLVRALGETQTMQEVEEALSRRRLWAALRDFYIRHSRRNLAPTARREAQQKALQLALHLAPHPPHALQILMEWLASPQPPNATLLQLVIARFAKLQWTTHLAQLLEAIWPTGLLGQQSEIYRQAAQKLQAQQSPSSLPLEEPLQQAQRLERFATRQPDPLVARQYLIQAAQLYAQSDPAKATACWKQLFEKYPRSNELAQALYDATIPQQHWEILNAVLPRPLPSSHFLPSSPALLLPLLQALHQNLLPETDPLPFFLQAFLLAPHNPRRLQSLVELLQARQQWLSLSRIYKLHLASIEDPFQIRQTLLQLAQLHQQRLAESQQAFTSTLLAFTFSPHDHQLLYTLFQWRDAFPPSHPYYRILETLAREGKGNVHFRLQVAQHLQQLPQGVERAVNIYQQILDKHPQHLEAIQQWRQLALLHKRHLEALKLYQQELKIQQDPAVRASLLCSLARMLAFDRKQPDHAIKAYQKALILTPHMPEILRPLADLLRQQQRWEELIPILQELLQSVANPQQCVQYLLEIARSATSLQQHNDALAALDKLLQFQPELPDTVDLIDQLQGQPQAQQDLLPFLQKALQNPALPENIKRQLQLQCTRLLFLLDQKQDALDLFQQLLSQHTSSQNFLYELEELALLHQAWPQAAQALHQRIQLLESNPAYANRLASLYAQLGELWHKQLHNPHQALSFYRLAQLFDPSDRAVLELLERTLSQIGAYHELRELLIQQTPQSSDRREAASIYTRIALLEHDHLQQHEIAYIHLRKAYELHPEQETIYPLLRQWAYEFQDEDLFREILQREMALSEAQENPETSLAQLHIELARSFERDGEPDLALVSWQKAHQLHPSHPDPLRAMSQSYYQIGDLAKARTLIETLLKTPQQLSTSEYQFYQQMLARIISPQAGSFSGTFQAPAESSPIAKICLRLDDSIQRQKPLEQQLTHLSELARHFQYLLHRPQMALATYRFGLQLAPEHPMLLQAAAILAPSPQEEISLWTRLFLAEPKSIDPLLRIAIVWKAEGETNGLALIASILQHYGESLPFIAPPSPPQPFWPQAPVSSEDQISICSFPSYCIPNLQLFRSLSQQEHLWRSSLPPNPPPAGAKSLSPQDPSSIIFTQTAALFGFSNTPLLQLQGTKETINLHHTPQNTLVLQHNPKQQKPLHQRRFLLGRALSLMFSPLRSYTILGPSGDELIEALRLQKDRPASVPEPVWLIASSAAPRPDTLATAEAWKQAVQLATAHAGLVASHSFENAAAYVRSLQAAPQDAFHKELRASNQLQRFMRFALSHRHLRLRKKLQVPLYAPADLQGL